MLLDRQRYYSNLQIEERSSRLLRNLSSCEKKAWKKIQAWTGFEQMTSAMPVRCSTNWAIKPTGSWSYYSFIRSSNICFIYLHSFIHPSRVYYELTIWPAPSWLDSSVGRALHRHRRGHGFESRSSLNFFQAFFSQLLKLRSNCEDLSSIWSFIRSSNICFIYLHSFIPTLLNC